MIEGKKRPEKNKTAKFEYKILEERPCFKHFDLNPNPGLPVARVFLDEIDRVSGQ